MSRDEIIKGLECCTADDGCAEGCPYFHRYGSDCAMRLKEDALALLKAQEPCVLTVDEIRSAFKGSVWFESRNGRVYTGWALVYDIQVGRGITGERLGLTQDNGHVMWLRLEDYGKTWRCWSSRPTEEQMRAEAWE